MTYITVKSYDGKKLWTWEVGSGVSFIEIVEIIGKGLSEIERGVAS